MKTDLVARWLARQSSTLAHVAVFESSARTASVTIDASEDRDAMVAAIAEACEDIAAAQESRVRVRLVAREKQGKQFVDGADFRIVVDAPKIAHDPDAPLDTHDAGSVTALALRGMEASQKQVERLISSMTESHTKLHLATTEALDSMRVRLAEVTKERDAAMATANAATSAAEELGDRAIEAERKNASRDLATKAIEQLVKEHGEQIIDRLLLAGKSFMDGLSTKTDNKKLPEASSSNNGSSSSTPTTNT